MQLFRPEALEGQDRLHGDVVLVPQVSWRLLGAFFAASLAAAALFLALARHDAAVPVDGRLTGDGATLRAVFEIPAAAAESVEPGQPLRLSLLGTSHSFDGRVDRIGSAPGGTAVVQATLDSAAASGSEQPLRAGMAVRSRLGARPRTLAQWLFGSLFGDGRS